VTDPGVERLVLRHLEGRPLSRVELVSRTGATDHQVQAALDELVGTAHVVRRPQDIGPADYELTPVGVEHLARIGRMTAAPVPTAKRPVVKRQPAAKRRPLVRRPTVAVRTPRFEAEPEPADRELIVRLAKDLAVGVVFSGVMIATHTSLLMLSLVFLITGVRMFSTYRTWAKKRRSE
jgi:hypothetical protein